MLITDPRTKAYLVLLSSFLLLFHLSVYSKHLFVLLIVILFIFMKKPKTALKLFALYTFTTLIGFYNGDNPIIHFVLYLGMSMNLMLPSIYAGIYLCTTTRTSEMISALRKCKISEKIIIPICVIIRFFPTVISDIKNIHHAMMLTESIVTASQLYTFEIIF